MVSLPISRSLGTVQEESHSELREIIALILECQWVSEDRKIRVNLSLIALQFLALIYKKTNFASCRSGLESRDSGAFYFIFNWICIQNNNVDQNSMCYAQAGAGPSQC